MVDLPGSESLQILNRIYLRDTHAAIIIFDLTSETAKSDCDKALDELREFAPSAAIFALVGTKKDLVSDNPVSKFDLKAQQVWCQRQGI